MDQMENPEAFLNELIDKGDGSRAVVPETNADPVEFFNLHAQPFNDNVNPEFFYRTEAHEEAFLAMKRCIDEHISLGLTTAISGTGKTLLTQVLIQELDPRKFQPILILCHPGMTGNGLLREIADELKLEMPKRRTTQDLIWAIQAHIISLYIKGLRLVLIIDEVHFLTAEPLHILRTLSNLEVPERKLVTVLLFGEQCFLEKMKRPDFKAVFSRMFTRVELRPLRGQEIAQYVKFRLLVAGGRPALFADDVFAPLEGLSQGIPRELNRICHNALIWAARHGQESITAETLRQLVEAHRV
ncbi:MAG: AAA family ATPase [Candidatus Sumerlaeia bacterium]